MSAIKVIKRTVELGGDMASSSFPDPIPPYFFNDETDAHMFMIFVRQNGQPFPFTTESVSACFLNDIGTTVSITGSIVNGAACVTLSDACYQVSGSFTLTISVSGAVVYECLGTVKVRSSNTAYDPSGEISVAALSAEIAAMCAATAAANAAASYATSSAAGIDTKLDRLGQQKVNRPETNPDGIAGQVLRTNGDGTTTWVTQGLPTDEQTAEAVNAWLDDHPEATTTVQDGSITSQKLAPGVLETVTPEMYGAKGDGQTDDTTAIQTALNTGKHVIFTRGHTYLISAALTAPASTRIHGNGAKLQMTADSPITQAWDQGAYIDANAGFILTASYVYDLQIDGGGYKWSVGLSVADTSLNAEILRCKITNISNDTYSVRGILINDDADYGTSCRIAYCEIANLSSPSNGVVNDAKGTCVGISGYCYKALTIENNTIHGIHAPVPSGASYLPDDAYGVYVAYKNSKRIAAIVRGNLIYSVDNTGIKWHNPGTVVEHNQINMDTLATGDVKMAYGLRFYGANSVVRNNRIIYTGAASMRGLLAETQGANAIIEGNVFDCGAGTLVMTVQSSNNTVRKNTLVSTMESTSEPVFSISGTNNIVDDNQISGTYTVLINGENHTLTNNRISGEVRLSYVKAPYIANNIITGFIRISASNASNPCAKIVANDFTYFLASQKVYDIEITGNTIRGESSGGAAAFVGGVDSLVFQHNIISGSSKGLVCGNSTKLSIVGNIIANAETPINASYSTGAIILGNLYKNGAVATVTGATGLVNENNGNMPA